MGVNTNSTVVLDKALTKDNYLTFAEAQSDIEVSGMVSGDAKQGDTVTVTIDDSQYVAVVGADYTFTVSIPGNTLANSKNKVLTASLETTDLDGNVAVATDSATFGAYQASVSSATLLNNDDETTSNPGWAINLDEATIEDTTVTLSINDALHSANYGRDYSGVMQVFSLSGELLTEVTLGKENKFKADITIPAGEEGVAVYAVTNDDSSYTGDETIVIRVLTENGWLNSETAIISDESDKPTVASVSDSIVNEGGQAEFTFTLSNPSDFDTKVLVSPQADNSDIDFDNLWVDLGKGWAQANGEVTSDGTWITVPSSVKEVKLRVDVVEDSEVEGNEAFTVSVLAEGQSEPATGTITIVDVVATPPLVESITVLQEDVESGEAPAFQLNLTNAYSQDTEITLNVSDILHDVDFGKDYDGAIQIYSLAGELLDEINLGTQNAFKAVTNIPAGEESVVVRANLIDDNLYEGEESLIIRAAVSGKQGWVKSDAATITDETDTVTVAAVSDTTVFEGNSAELTVTMSNPSVANNTVFLTSSNSNDVDLENVSVNFGKGWVNASIDTNTNQISIDVPGSVTLFNVRFDTISDGIYEGNETFTISANVEGQTESASGNVTIKDIAGVPTVESILAVRDGIEGGDAPGFKVNMTSVSASDTTVTLNVVDSLHDVKYGLDYSGVFQIYSVSGEFLTEVTLSKDNKFKADITVPAGDDGVVVYVMTTDDTVYEGPESVVIRAAVSGKQGWVKSEAALITDENDNPVVTSIADVNVDEGEEIQTTVTLNGPSIKPVDVTLTAQIDDSPINLNNLSVNFGSGWVSVSGTTFTVPASVDTFEVRFDNTDNDVYNGDQIITLSASTSEQTEAVTNTVTINDDADRPLVDNITVVQEDMEGGKLPGYQVNMTNTSTTDTTFKLTLSDGLHSSGFFVDYTGVIQVYSLDGEFLEEVALSSANRFKADVTVPAGDSGVLVYVEGVNDDIYEGDETLVIRAGVLGQQGWVNSDAATITDEEDRPSVSSITFLNDGSEDGQAAGFTLNMSNVSTTSTTVQLHVNDALHQATIGEDYSGVMQIYSLDGKHLLQEVTLTSENGYLADITIPAWAEGVIIYAETLSDKLEEIDESLVIQAAIIDEQDWVTSEAATIIDIDNIAPGEGTGPNGTDEAPVVVIPEATGGVGEDELTDGVDVLVTPPTGTKPGDIITVTVTQPDGTTSEVTTTVPGDWTGGTAVPVTLSPEDLGGAGGELPDEGDYTITATVTDSAGNTSKPSEETGFTVDITAPGEGTGTGGTDEAPVVVIPEATGGVGEDELTDGVDVLVTPPTGTKPGDIITVTVTQPDGTTSEVTTTVPSDWTGGTAVPVTLSPEDLGGAGGELPDEGDYTITATVTDSAGNTSTPSEETGFTVDITAPGEGTGTGGTDEAPVVVIPEATGGVGEDELTDGVDVLVTPPTGTKPGDIITVTVTQPDGTTSEVTTTVPSDWTGGTAVPVTLSPEDLGGAGGELPDEGDYTITATVTDSAGNTSTPSEETGFTVDITAPGEGTGTGGTDEAPVVVIPEATGGVGEDELTDGVDVLVTPPTGTKPGDIITVTVTQPDGTTSEVTTTVPSDWTGGTAVPVTLSPEDLGGAGGELPDEGDYTITATVTDSAGNTSTPSEETGFTVDITAPDSSSTHLTINTISADNIVNAQESKESINVTGTVTGEFNAGDQVTVSVNGNDFTGNVSPSGQFSIAVPGDQLVADPDSIINVQLEATDSAGNTGVINGTQSYSVDLAAQASITLDANIAEDGAINYAESQQNIDITGTVNGDVKPGDIVTVAVNNVEYTSTVNADNTFSVAVSGADLAASADKTVTANVTATDNAGNTVTVSDSETYTAFKAKVESVTHLRDGVEGSTSPGWTVNFDHAAIEDTTVRLNFNDGYHQANFGADYSGKVVIYNLAGQKVGEEVLSAANNWRVDISVPAGELGVRVYAETLNDDVYEGNETIQIQAAVPGRQEFVQSAEAVITDNADIPKVASITHLQDATEGGQWAGWTVNMTNASTTDSTVQLNFQDGLHQANFGADYSGTVHVYTKDGTLLQEVELNASNHYKADITIPAGHSGVNIYADTLNDDVYEGSETIVIQGAVPGRQEFVQSAEAVITDNADIPKVESITAFQNAIEGDQWAGWNVNMTNTSTTATTVRLKFDDALHQAGITNHGDDYNGQVNVHDLNGNFLQTVILNAANSYQADITIPAGHAGVQVSAATLQDNVYEGNETLVISGAVIDQQGWVQSNNALIIDNADIPKVESITAFQNAIEGDQWAGWNVNMTNTSTTATTVRLKFDDALHQAGITNHGDDYNGQVNVHDLNGNFLQTVILNAANSYQADITIPAGHAGVQVSAATLQDNVYEGNETLVISGAVIDQQGWVQSNNALIIDNADIPKVESITAFQNAIEGDQWAGWNVNMTNTSTTATTVRLKFDDALHQAGITNHGDDYNGQVNVHDLNGNFLQTVILNAANSYQADITIPAGHAGVQVSAATLQDNVYEGNETLVISGAVIDQQGWVQSNNALIIDNADIPKVESITAFQNAIEGDQWAGWNVNMTNTSTTATTVRLKFDDALHQAGITNHGDDYNGQVNVHDLNGNFLQTVILNAANSYQADITIPAGHAGVQVSAATLQDNVYEGNETLVISGAVIDQQGWVQSNNALIIDNADIPKVESITAFQNAIEGDQWAGWNVNMTNTSTTATTVRLKFDDALHQAGITNHGDDYNGQVNVHDLNGNFLQTVILNAANSYQADITIPAGHAGVQVSAATLQDNVYEGNETLVISGAVIDQQGWVQSNNALIIDNADIPKVESITAFQNAIEGDQWAGWNVNMTNTSTTATTVRLKFDDALHQAGITNHGDDYNGQVNVHDLNGNFLQTVILNAANSYQADITIPAGHAGVQVSAATLQDNVYEGNETLVISGAVIDQQGWVQSNNALIIDNADIPKVESITAFQNAIEGDQWAGWNVNMTNTSTTATTVRLKFDDALHQAGITNHGDDYNGQVNVHDLNGNFLQTVILNAANSYQADITIPAGHAGVQVSAATLQDNVYEGNETLVISGAVIDQQGWVQSNNALIIDNADIPKVESITAFQNAIEGDQWAGWNVNMTNTSTTATTVRLKFDDALHQAGITNHGDDYNGQVNVHDLNGNFLQTVILNAANSYQADITIPAGHAGVQVSAATLQDNVYEGNETLVISGAVIDQQGWVQSNNALIIDNADIPKVESITAFQNAIEGDQWAGWNVNMTNTSTTATTVRLKFDDALHQAGITNHGDDYNGQVNVHDLNGNFLQTVILNAANSYQADITIPAGHAGVQVSAATLQDNVYEGNETLVISGAVIDQQGWVQSNNALIIDNADIPKVESITAFQNAIEGDQWAGWNVNMTNTSTTATTVRLKFDDALHQAGITNHGDDYNGQVNVHDLNGNFLQTVILNAANSYQADITIPAGHAGVQVSAATLQDNVYEGNETLVISGAVIDQQGWVQSQAAVITDEADKPTLSIVNTNGNNSVTESNWATFTIKLSNPVDQATKVKVNVYTGASPDVNNKDMGGYEYWTGSSWANFKSGSQLTFAAHQTELQVRAKPINDNKVEGNERLIVKAQPVVDETHIGDGEVQSAITVIDKGYRDTSNDTAGHIHWHIDGGGTQHVNGNGWRPHEIVTIYNPNGSSTVIYADKHGFFNINAENLYTVAGTLNAKGAQSGWAVGSKYVNPSVTPIVLDLDGDGIETSDVTENPVHFDYDGDGKDVKTGWIAGGDGLLVRDINKDGQINDGSELFGSNTQLADGSTAVDGYEALAQHDSNADGVIDKNDAIYAELGVWVDKDQDGETDEGELLSIDEANVASIELTATITSNESNNNTIGKSSSYTTMDGEERVAADVWFATQQGETEEANTSNLIETHSISGLDSDELTWHSEDVASQPWSDTVTDFTIGEPPLDLSDLVTDGDDNLLSEDDVDMYEQDGSTVLRVDTNGDHVWNQEIILQDVSLDDIVDENGIIKNGVFGDNNVKALFQKAASVDAIDSSTSHLDDPRIDDQ
ncbi:Ig-like domain-containing protein [Enterovibrio norvegicus]|uniref:Ig-like domain-containing protein n=1 Tax=Enterovibrio norvegicus TaxID=188144 RepID=UPI0024B266AF|nr:Ig-like domain-containing protein [Enterovibrio norvegicus]